VSGSTGETVVIVGTTITFFVYFAVNNYTRDTFSDALA
jgi:hypothetical protein